jgi:predicted acylesterase/phospholipase RssA
VDDAIIKYKNLSEKVFTSKSNDPKATFDHMVLEREIKDVVATTVIGGQSPSIELMDSRIDMCRTFVVAMSRHAGGAVRLRTYQTRDADPFHASIWQAGRATLAAPTFFAPIEIDDVVYGDGGTGWNNPTEEAIAEAGNIWPNSVIGIVISIGTGLENVLELEDEPTQLSIIAKFFLRYTFPKTLFKIAVAQYAVHGLTSCEMVHREISERLNRDILDGNYFRLNVPQGMSTIGLAEWDKINPMIALTKRYMELGEIIELKRKMANLLRDPQRASRSL